MPHKEQTGAEVDSSTAEQRIFILGGGFAGFQPAQYLDRTAAKHGDVEVTLVSREDFAVFTPMSHEAAADDFEVKPLVRGVTNTPAPKVDCAQALEDSCDYGRR